MRGRILEYFLITGIVWCFYALLLPVYFVAVFHWNLNDITKWWITGTPVEFVLAYPLGKILIRVGPRIKQICYGDVKNG